MSCQHGAFVIKSDVRTLREAVDGPVVKYALDSEVACYDCGMIFQLTRTELRPSMQYLKGHKTMNVKEVN